MKKAVALILTLFMLLCCFACGNTADQEAIRIIRKSLLRPDTFILRSAYSFSGCPFFASDYLYHPEIYDKLKQTNVNYIIISYTCENAYGAVVECFGVYDKDNNTAYRDEDIKDYIQGHTTGDPLFLVAFYMEGYLGIRKEIAEYGTNKVNQWIADGKLTKWDENKIDKINETFQK